MMQKKDSRISDISLNVDQLNMQQDLKYGHAREAEAQRRGGGTRAEAFASKYQSHKKSDVGQRSAKQAPRGIP